MNLFLFRTAAGMALLCSLAALSACTKSSNDLPTAPSRLQKSLDITAAPMTLPADGISTSTITATVTSEDPDPSRLTIQFSTNAGTLVGGTDAGNGVKEVVADASTRQATVQLQSSRTVGSAIVTATVKATAVAKTATVPFTQPDTSSVISFVESPAKGEADGESSHILRVQVSTGLPIGTNIVFETTHGKFLGSGMTMDTQPVDDTFFATAVLESPSAPAIAVVNAKTPNGVPASTRIPFTDAYPDVILVRVASSTVEPEGSVQVTANYLRDPGRGKVNTGLPVSFSALGADGRSIGSFRFPNGELVAASGDDRQTVADFMPGRADAQEVTITVRFPESDTEPGTTSVNVEVNVEPPVPAFTCTANELTVIFRDASTAGEATRWSWDFGDDATSDEEGPVHTYAQAGTYVVSLTVGNAGGEASLRQFLTLSGTDSNSNVCPASS